MAMHYEGSEKASSSGLFSDVQWNG